MPELTAGDVFALSDASGRRFLALSDCTGASELRVVPIVVPSDSPHSGLMPLRRDDTEPSVFPAAVELDCVSWMSVATPAVIARASTGCRARIHRALCRREAALYACVTGTPTKFRPGVTPIPASGKVIGAPELRNLIDASLDGWLTSGRFDVEFRRRLGRFLGRRHVVTTNSGSSANLLAVSALTSPLLGDRALEAGDEVITVAAGFPTTVNPILQNNLVPVFVDVELGTYNADADRVAEAVGPRTRAIILAHTLGNPFDLDRITTIARRHGLWLIEDCCDALGSTYNGRKVGTFGDIGTLSFYPAHHITMGEGGAVVTDDDILQKAVESIRDWGRDCYCAPGKENTCLQRFDWQLGELPHGYDHKYTYSHLGYNLKITDMQAAVGVAQLDRLDGFIESRRHNFDLLSRNLEACEDRLVLPVATPCSDPSWFGFPITIRETAGVEREALLRHLTDRKIGTRLLFGGNLVSQPYFSGREHRVCGSLDATDSVMMETFWIGLYPGLTEDMLDYSAATIPYVMGEEHDRFRPFRWRSLDQRRHALLQRGGTTSSRSTRGFEPYSHSNRCKYEHIFIDNASTDGTIEKVKRIAPAIPMSDLIVNARNFGHIRSPYHAILQARGDAVIAMASDLQDPPELIPQFIDAWDMATGSLPA